MAETDELSAEQRERLRQFQVLTGSENTERCRSILHGHLWSIQAAVHTTLHEEERGSRDVSPLTPCREQRPRRANPRPFDQRMVTFQSEQLEMIKWAYDIFGILVFPFLCFYGGILKLLSFVYHKFLSDPQGETFRNIVARTEMRMTSEEACPHGFVETLAFWQARKFLRNQGSSIITGPPGSGKTTLARQLLLSFRKEGFLPVEFDVVSEFLNTSWTKVSDAKTKVLVCVDNVVGRRTLDIGLLVEWGKYLDVLMPLISSGQVKLLLVSCLHIYSMLRGKGLNRELLFSSPEVALTSEKMSLSFERRKQILENFLAYRNVNLSSSVSVDIFARAGKDFPFIGYPQLCSYFVTCREVQKHPQDYFSNPVRFLKSKLSRLRLVNRTSFFLLMLMVYREGRVSESLLKSQKNKIVVMAVARLVRLSVFPTYAELKESAGQLRGLYLEYDSSSKSYVFSHQSVWDSLFLLLCDRNLEKALEVCSCKQMVLYLRIEGCIREEEGLIFLVPSENWPALATRLLQEMVRGDVDLACSHPSLQNRDFAKIFLQEILKKKSLYGLLKQKSLERWEECGVITISLEAYNNCYLDGNFFSCMTHEGCGGTSSVIPIIKHKRSLSSLILRNCVGIARHILEFSVFSSLPQELQTQVLAEILACACFASDLDLVNYLLKKGATPFLQCVRAACCGQSENLELVQMALQWCRPLSEDLLCELARLVCQKDRPGTLELILSELPESDNHQAELDNILAELVLLTHPAELIGFERKLELSRLAELIEVLRLKGATCSSINFFFAASHSENSVLLDLLRVESHVTRRDDTGHTPLHWAARFGALSSVQLLVSRTDQHSEYVNAQSQDGNSCLHLAARYGHLAVAEVIVKSGADANLVNKENKTALHELADSHDLLLAGVAAEAGDGSRRREEAKESDPRDLIRSLIRATSKLRRSSGDYWGDTALHISAKLGHQLVAELLVESGAAVDARSRDGDTPLHYAASGGHLEVVGFLLDHKAAVNVKNEDGSTPLHCAATRGHLSVVELLMTRGAKYSLLCARGDTLLHRLAGPDCLRNKERWAVESQRTVASVTERLARYVNVKNKGGETPLHLALKYCNFCVLDELLKQQVDLSVIDEGGNTALHALAAGERLHDLCLSDTTVEQTVLCLVEKCVPMVNAKNAVGETPLFTALRFGNFYLVDLFLSAECDVTLTMNGGHTLLHALASCWSLNSRFGESIAVQRTVVSLMTLCADLVNVRNDAGEPPLFTALRSGNFCLVEEFLAPLCDLAARVDGGNTLLHVLAGLWDLDDRKYPNASFAVRLLVEKCSPLVDSQNQGGDTPVMVALREGNSCVVELLLKRGCDLTLRNRQQQTVLHVMAGVGVSRGKKSKWRDVTTRVDSLARSAGLHPDMPDVRGRTPAEIAVAEFNLWRDWYYGNHLLSLWGIRCNKDRQL